jgi:hypothetical protein
MRPAEEVRVAHWPLNHVAEHPVGFDMCFALQLKSSAKFLTRKQAVSARHPGHGSSKQGRRRGAIANGDVPRD